MKTLHNNTNIPGTSTTDMLLSSLTPLYPVVQNNFFDTIKEDIRVNGLVLPLIVWETTGKYWRKQVRFTNPELINYPPEDLDDETIVNLVMAGNNRYKAAIDLGYDFISVVKCTNREDINKLCGISREHWQKAQAT